MKTKVICFILGVIVCMVAVWGTDVIKCEMQTREHRSEFLEVYSEFEGTTLGNTECLKVMEYSRYGDFAKVYYISKGKEAGTLVRLSKNDGEWEIESNDTLWSKSGNADRVLYPYWWHCFYFLF